MPSLRLPGISTRCRQWHLELNTAMKHEVEHIAGTVPARHELSVSAGEGSMTDTSSTTGIAITPWARTSRRPRQSDRQARRVFLKARHDANRPAKDERMRQKGGIDHQRAVDRRDAHPVAVVAHSRRPLPWGQHAGMKHPGAVGRGPGATQNSPVYCQMGLAPRPVPIGSRIPAESRIGAAGRGRWPRGGCGFRP